MAYSKQNKFSEALPQFEKVLAINNQAEKSSNQSVGDALHNIGEVCFNKEKYVLKIHPKWWLTIKRKSSNLVCHEI